MIPALEVAADTLGRGLLAGLAGTAIMTLAQTVEMAMTHRQPSATPATAAGKVLEIQPRNATGKSRFSTIVHWSYGTAWGVVRAVLALIGLPWIAATVVHFAFVWVVAMLMLPALRVAPPVRDWGGGEIAKDGFFHLIYAVATGWAFALVSA